MTSEQQPLPSSPGLTKSIILDVRSWVSPAQPGPRVLLKDII